MNEFNDISCFSRVVLLYVFLQKLFMTLLLIPLYSEKVKYIIKPIKTKKLFPFSEI